MNETLKKDLYDHLYIHVLPGGFLRKNIIRKTEGLPTYNYEMFLLEFINQSHLFLTKSNGEYYHKPISESNGECDAISCTYEVDFKLILGQSRTQVLKKTSQRITVLSNGGIAYGIPEEIGKHQCIDLHLALKGKSVAELKKICKDCNSNDLINRDINAYLKSIMHNKNLLLLFPFIFEYKGDFDISINEIIEAIYDDFSTSLSFRNELYAKDTYFSFFYDKHFHILQFVEGRLIHKEKIPIDSSNIFIELVNYYSFKYPFSTWV